MEGDPIRVSAYFADEAQHRQAEEMLADSETFANVIEGSLRPDQLPALSATGVVVEVLAAGDSPTSPVAQEPDETDAVRYLADQAQYANLPRPDGRPPGSGQGETEADKAHSGSEEIPDEDAYWIELSCPITRQQRLEFDSFGVDIAAFEPPDRYRTILTRDQHAQVRRLPFVRGVTPYRFGDALTTDLVEMVEEEMDQPPGLASDEGADEPKVFDVIVHRERDLPRIQALIDDVPDAEVLGTSNLRVRFSAGSDLPLLAALADRVEVRKLAPFDRRTI
jgi:hypothetical protein